MWGFFSNIWSFGGKFYLSRKRYEERAYYGTALCVIVFGHNAATWSLQRDFSECCIEALEVMEDASVLCKETQHIDLWGTAGLHSHMQIVQRC